MTVIANPPYPSYFDVDGSPLEDGYIYFGAANQNPETNPITVYWDAAYTQPALQPIRTSGGFTYRAGTPANIYVSTDFSITVRDKNRRLVYSKLLSEGQTTAEVNLQYSTQSITATAGQTVFGLSTAYTPGNNSLAVYHNGSRLIVGSDYTETSATVITLAIGATAGDVLQFVTATPINPSSLGAAAVAYIPAGTGAVATNVQAKLRESVSVRDFGAVGDGVTDDTAAIQAAIAQLKLIGGGVLELVNGASYLLNGIAGADGTLNGILQPYTSDNGTTGRIYIKGNFAKLLAGSDNMILLRTSDSHNGAENLILDGNNKVGVTGHAVYPESITQTSTQVSQSYNRFSGFYITRCTEGLALKCGPLAGFASGCYYNYFVGYKFFGCVRSVWLRSPTNAGGSIVNRNTFEGFRFGQGFTSNTGVQIDAGDTNTFIACHGEIVSYGTAPNATPTAFKIANTDAVTGLANQSNRFMSCVAEACTRDLDNANSYTEVYGCLFAGSKSLYTATPRVMIGGSDPSVVPQVLPGYRYQSNAYLAGVDLNVMWLSGGLALAPNSYAYDQANVWQNYAITTGILTNVSSVVNQYSKFQRLGGFVDFSARFKFQATSVSASVTLQLPKTPAAHYTTFSTLQPMLIPVVVVGALGQTATTYARFEAGSNILTVYAPSFNWHASNSSEIHINARYIETGF